MRRLCKTMALAGFLLAPVVVQADVAAWEFTDAANAYSNGSWTFGIDFMVKDSNITVDQLGYYDDSGDGFVDDHEVGIYDDAHNLLASTIVVSGDPLLGHFRYHAITPIDLLAGETYRMVGVSHGDLYTWFNPGFATDPSITYLGDSYDAGTTLFDPIPTIRNDVHDGFFGPDFLIADTTAVPEPSAFALLGSALGAVWLARRKRVRS